MALDFPTSPTNGQEYQNWIYSSSKGAWQAKPLTGPKTITADVPPLNPQDGDQWYNTLDGTLYVYVVDVDSSQWVESTAPISANGYYSPNYIINGGMDFWQRGTSGSIAGTVGFAADRWQSVTYAGGTMYWFRQDAGANPAGTKYCARVQRASGTSNAATLNLSYSFESTDVIKFANKTITFSFYARAGANYSPAGAQLNYALIWGTGADQAVFTGSGITGGGDLIRTSVPGGLTSSWQRFTTTVNVPSNATSFGISIYSGTMVGTAGAADYYDITGLQLEEGSVATPFRRNANSIQGELAACQRYYYRMVSVGSSTVFCTGGAESTTGGAVGGQSFPVEMRAIPTPSFINCSVYSSAGGSRAFTVTTGRLTTKTVSLDVISSGFAAGQVIVLYASSGTSSYVEWNAEL